MHLNLTESCAEAGIYATSEAERAYWLSREKSYLTASVEIDVHAFHDALGLMYPMNWRSSQNGECETFMLAEMVCGNVTEIYARIGTGRGWSWSAGMPKHAAGNALSLTA